MTSGTYAEIQAWIKKQHGITVKTCWIAHAKELSGLNPAPAYNRRSLTSRTHLCPPSKLPIIQEAFRHFGMI